MKTEADVWEMLEGKLTCVRIGDWLFRVDSSPDPEVKVNLDPKVKIKIHHKKLGRIPSLQKWIKDNIRVGDVFCLEEFFKEHPNQKRQHQRLRPVISDMCGDKVIQQLSPDTFKVLKC